MRFVNYHRAGPSYDLFMDQRDRPVPGTGEVLVEVYAIGVNRADLLQRKGHYPPPSGASDILGLECSGVIREVGAQVEQWTLGDEVCGLVDGGAYAEYCTMDAGMIWRKPDRMTWAAAAALPEAYLTAYQALFVLMDVTGMEHVLIHAAASGVGSAAVQLLKDRDLRIWGTASGAKQAYCLESGFHNVIDYKKESFQKKIMEWTDGSGVDGIVDFIGAPYFRDNIHSLSIDGTMIMLGMLGGIRLPEIDLLPIITRRLKIQGSTLRSRSRKYKRELTAAFLGQFGKHLETGILEPYVFEIFDWTDVHKAHVLMASNKSRGKLVLKIPRPK